VTVKKMRVDLGLLVLRVTIGLLFAAHGAQKAFGWWGGPGFGGWTNAVTNMGWHPARLWALLSIVAELGGGLLLTVGVLTPFATAVLVAQTTVIIERVHLRNGFWNSTGGIEYPLTLGLGAAALYLAAPGALSLDRALGWSFGLPIQFAALAVAFVGAAAALLWSSPARNRRPARA
jgi:putative oxidoreductase